ncbi:MAG: hypothetical protein Q8L38_01640 [Pseudohongiella sp.]|nr:hypothetical protein [Pseudohongiella sp.]
MNTFPCTTDPELTMQIAEWSGIPKPHWDSTRIVAWDDNRLQSLVIKLTKKSVGLIGWFKQ